jgi:hypothetical protein
VINTGKSGLGWGGGSGGSAASGFNAQRGSRQCSRTACSAAAVVTLTYEYKSSQVWLDALSAERDPHAYDLCRRHAEQLKVPLGWHLIDRREPVEARDLLAG